MARRRKIILGSELPQLLATKENSKGYLMNEITDLLRAAMLTGGPGETV